ncbi:MAG: hypothetical protein K2Z81_23530 [Cyanobacteria bacterium]|nr:hypothetical protein [Cyanobacteriota bacterium]
MSSPFEANFQNPQEDLSNQLSFTDVVAVNDTTTCNTDNTSTLTGDGRTNDTVAPLFASPSDTGSNGGLFPSPQSLLGDDLNFGEGAPANYFTSAETPVRVGDTPPTPAPRGDTPPAPGSDAPPRSPMSSESLNRLAEQFRISPEVLRAVQGLAEQFGLGHLFTEQNVQKFLEVAQQHGITQYMTPENMQMARQYAEGFIQQQGGIGQIIARARENPEAALNMITSALPEEVRGQATAFVQGLMSRFRPTPTPNPNPNPNPR